MYLLPFFLFLLFSLPLLVSSHSVSVKVEVGAESSPAASASASALTSADIDSASPADPLPYSPNVRRCGSSNRGYCTFRPICDRVGGSVLARQSSSPSLTRNCWGTYKEICCDEAESSPFDDPLPVNPTALSNLLAFLNSNRQIHRELKKVAIADFTLHGRERRFFYWDFQAPVAGQRVTEDNLLNQQNVPIAHGVGSDPDRDNMATVFSNRPGSLMTSLGFYRVAELYTGMFGFSARMDGLSVSNSRARPRAIVMHPWNGVEYNMPTEGCFGFVDEIAIQIEKEMSFKGIIYAFGGQTERDPNDSLIVPLHSLRSLHPPKPTTKPRRK